MNARTKTISKAAQVVEEVTDWSKIDTQIDFEGRKIKLPADPTQMDYDDAIDTIARIRDQENQEFDVHELVAGAPWDTAVAVYRAMQDIYGVVMAQSVQTFFGEIKPDFLTVHTGPNPQDRIQVPVGQMSLPGVSAPVNVVMRSGGTIIAGTVKKRDRARLIEIANRAREIIRKDSVYKGKALRFHVDEDGALVLNQQPEFLDLSAVKETDIIHTRETGALVETNIFAPLKHTAACRANRVPLKRGILLEGKYGTGKSLTARVTAKIAIDNGWTFILLNRSQGLRAAIEFAREYQPCVIFAEDIDRSADREDENVNDLVNLLDGVITKQMEMMVVLTTNHIERIDRALLRPGRFDAVISIDAPDAETAQRIIRAYSGNLLDGSEDLTEVGEAVAGMIPASIREVVERAKLGMLTYGRDVITAADLYASAIGMQRHMALLNPVEDTKSNADLFAESLVGILGDHMAEALEIDTSGLTDLNTRTKKIVSMISNVGDAVTKVGAVTKAGAEAAERGRRMTKEIAEHLDV